MGKRTATNRRPQTQKDTAVSRKVTQVQELRRSNAAVAIESAMPPSVAFTWRTDQWLRSFLRM
jgi:hypothetical protein